MTPVEKRALYTTKPYEYHACFHAKKLNKGEKHMYREDACFIYQKEHMFRENREALTGKCTTKDCQKLWDKYERSTDQLLPTYTVCDQVCARCAGAARPGLTWDRGQRDGRGDPQADRR